VKLTICRLEPYNSNKGNNGNNINKLDMDHTGTNSNDDDDSNKGNDGNDINKCIEEDKGSMDEHSDDDIVKDDYSMDFLKSNDKI
jgi:hypothetical protein